MSAAKSDKLYYITIILIAVLLLGPYFGLNLSRLSSDSSTGSNSVVSPVSPRQIERRVPAKSGDGDQSNPLSEIEQLLR